MYSYIINRALETFKENVKISAKGSLRLLAQCKQWFSKGIRNCYEFQRKQAKLHWVQDPSQMNVGPLNNVRLEASRHFINKRREYMKEKINELASDSNI
jgi:hypothetical protein